jgi:alkylated DNA repair dioxygenase AlkB
VRGQAQLLGDGALLDFDEQWLEPDAAGALFERLSGELPWRQKTIRMFGRDIAEPRLSAWIGDPDAVYVYSGVSHRPAPWTATTAELRDRLRDRLGVAFNSVLANLYRDGRDSMGWHADDEPELGPEPTIASVSLGATRRFVFRHRRDNRRKLEIPLPSGSLLVMAGTTQRDWKHAVPKQRAPVGPRINLTYRLIRGQAPVS